MYKFYLVLFFYPLINLLPLNAQIPCYEAPSLGFSGTPILFSYMVEDTTIMDRCQGIIFDRHRGQIFTKPFEYEDLYILSAKAVTGSILLGIDQNTHEIVWSRYDNHLVNRQERSMTNGAFRKKEGDSLEILTYHSFSVYEGNSMPSTSGYPGRRIINYKTGETLSDYWVGDSLKVNGVDFAKAFYVIYMGADNFPRNIPGSDMYHFAFLAISASDTASFSIDHRYVDTSTLTVYWTIAPQFQLQGIASPRIFLDCSENGVHPRNLLTFGPFILGENRKMYLLRYLLHGVVRTRKVVLDEWGFLLENEELTQKMGEANTNGLWLVSDVYMTKDGHLLFEGGVKNGSEFWESGHGSYIIIDTLGNLIKSSKKLDFDNLRPFLHSVCELPHRNSLMHVFRPQENNDLYFYEEFEDGTYRKAGQLINPNNSFYAFDPHQIGLMKNGDMYLHLTVLVDSISGAGGNSNFNSGGWKAMIRVDGNALGITVSTKDVGSTKNNYKVYPNPASTEIRIASETAIFPLTGHIYNKLGQNLQSFVLESQEQTIDISNLPSDIYYIQMLDKSQSPIINTLKWVKVE